MTNMARSSAKRNSRTVKLAGVEDIEAVAGRELTPSELDALYVMPGGVERLERGKLRYGPFRTEILAEADRCAKGNDRQRARALRSVARALGKHKGIGEDDWTSLVSASLTCESPQCPECGLPIDVRLPGVAACPECGAIFDVKGGPESWLTVSGPDGATITSIARLVRRG